MSNAPDDHAGADDTASPSACETLDMIITPRVRDLGDGFKVRRILPFHKRRMVGPFIFFDHFGPVDFEPGTGMDVRPHPHIGLATVTYLFEGVIAHKDTVGSDVVIGPGAVNWMTAGRGIAHSERTPPAARASGQRIHGIQTWLALPRELEEIAPNFVHHCKDDIPAFDVGGAQMRLLAGDGWGHSSPVSFPHPIWYLAGDAPDGASFTIPKDAAEERALYVCEGRIQLGSEQLTDGSMGILTAGCDVSVVAEPGAKFMLAGGAPIPERRYIDWNFVSSDTARIARARSDWQASIDGEWKDTPFAMPEGENEWIPLPQR